MTFTNFIPPKSWAYIVKLADENNLSTMEVQRILLNKILFELGMTCPHRRIGYAKEDPEHKPYCKDCWTRLYQNRERLYSFETKKWTTTNKFLPLDTFLDVTEKEKKNQGQVKKEEKEQFV